MGNFIDLTGERFGRLIVINREKNDSKNRIKWKCRCDCGNEIITYGSSLKNGFCRSCGCLHRETAREQGKKSKKHGFTNTRLYRVWTNMKTRCYNIKNKNYERWGARGITVCDEWRTDFMTFRNWALENGYEEGLYLDRIDNDGPYRPENCRWTTALEQANNTRSVRLIECHGERMSLHAWSRKLGISVTTLFNRLRRLSPEEAFYGKSFSVNT